MHSDLSGAIAEFDLAVKRDRECVMAYNDCGVAKQETGILRGQSPISAWLSNWTLLMLMLSPIEAWL